MTVVFIPTPLRRLTDGQARVTVSAGDIAGLLTQLDTDFPGLKNRVCDADGQVKRFVNLFVNGQEIRSLQGLATPLSEGDEVAIIPAMAGGARSDTDLSQGMAPLWPVSSVTSGQV